MDGFQDGSLWAGHDFGADERLSVIEKRLHINQPKKTKKVDVSKISFALLPAYINYGTAKDKAIVRARFRKGA